jgi:NADH:ubiquinone oxidoreductase subunit 4 (subunit M)
MIRVIDGEPLPQPAREAPAVSGGLFQSLPVLLIAALVIGAIYMLRAIRDIWHGETVETPALQDASAWHKVPFVLLLAALIVVGVWPRLLTDKIEPSVKRIVTVVAPPTVAVIK